jgi:signal peptidase I
VAKRTKSSKSAKPGQKSRNVVAEARGKKPAARLTARGFWEHAKGILGAVLIFLFLRTFFIEAYRIPSGSMIPSLLIGDWLFVNKLVYGPHLPFTRINLPGYAEPKRFDVVVFVSPLQVDQAAQGLDPHPTLVKRIIGMPGDTLYMRDSKLYLNGKPLNERYGAGSEPGDPNLVDPLFDWQKEFDLDSSRLGKAPEQPSLDNWGPLVVPQQHFFMMGDNRYCSKDSRYWSFVPRENIRGKPMFIYYSHRPNNVETTACSGDVSTRPLSFITDIRWARIGHRIR